MKKKKKKNGIGIYFTTIYIALKKDSYLTWVSLAFSIFRHEALHEDVTEQERTKERLYEEEEEVVWEKGVNNC